MTHTTTTLSKSRIVFHKEGARAPWQRQLDAAARRLLDIVASGIGLIILSPLFALIALLIRRDSPGPIFYWGPRMGRGGHPFRILKFRTMYEDDASYNGPGITGKGDRRITPTGQWLRDTKLNELPQLWNVLIGDMSLVGPRPEDPDFVQAWSEETRHVLLSVRPGITSPASVLYREEEQLITSHNVVDSYLRDIMPGKLRLDLLYVRHRTLLADLDVIFWTAITLLPQLKRRQVPQHALYWGPLARFITRYFSWFLADLIAALAATTTAALIWRSGAPLHLGAELLLLIAFGIAIIFSIVNALLGLHRVYWSRAPSNAVFDLAFSSLLTTTVLIVINHFWPSQPLLPVGLLLVTGLFAFLAFVAARFRTRILTGLATRWIQLRGQANAVGERVLIVGAGRLGDFALSLLRRSDTARAFSVIGLIDDAPRKQGLRIDGLPVLGNAADIPDLVKQHDIGLIIYAIADIDPDEKDQILSHCRQTPARLVIMPDILTILQTHLTGHHPSSTVHRPSSTVHRQS